MIARGRKLSYNPGPDPGFLGQLNAKPQDFEAESINPASLRMGPGTGVSPVQEQ